MKKDVKKWCQDCKICISRRGGARPRMAPLQPISIPPAPMELTAMDIIGPLPVSTKGNRYILVFMDYFTKWPEAYPMADQKATTIAKIFVEEIIFRYGAPKTILTDKGLNFTSKLLQSVNELFQIIKLNTSAYHPQTDGMVERFNRTLLDMLASYTNSSQNDWDCHIPSCLFAYRTSNHNATNESPFYLMYLRDTFMPTDHLLNTSETTSMETAEYITVMKQRLALAKSVAMANIEYSQESYKSYYDLQAQPVNIKEGDQVVIMTPKPKKGITPKLQRLYAGPFLVLEATGTNVKVILIGKASARPQWIHANRCRLLKSKETLPKLNTPNAIKSPTVDEIFNEEDDSIKGKRYFLRPPIVDEIFDEENDSTKGKRYFLRSKQRDAINLIKNTNLNFNKNPETISCGADSVFEIESFGTKLLWEVGYVGIYVGIYVRIYDFCPEADQLQLDGAQNQKATENSHGLL